MTKVNAIRILVAAATTLFVAAGCAAGQTTDQASGADQAAERGATAVSAADFAAATTRGLHLDYDALATPADAVATSELIVRGTLVDVTEGITFGGANAAEAGRGSSYVTFVIEVDAAVKGASAKGGTVHVVVYKSTAVTAGDLAKLNNRFPVIAVLDDITAWSPVPGVTVVRPAGMPAGGPLYMAFPDGLWLQGGADQVMTGLYAEAAALPAAWGTTRTLDEYAAKLQAASAPR